MGAAEMDDNTSAWASVVEKISTSSAINPSLVMTAICVPCGTALAYWATYPLSIAGAAIAGIAVISAIVQIQWFTFTDPDRLQHDKHIERKMLINQKSIGYLTKDGPLEVQIPDTSVLIENPSLPKEV